MPTNLSGLYDANGNLTWGTSKPVTAIGTDPAMGPTSTYNPLINNPDYFGGTPLANQPAPTVPTGQPGGLARPPGGGINQQTSPSTIQASTLPYQLNSEGMGEGQLGQGTTAPTNKSGSGYVPFTPLASPSTGNTVGVNTAGSLSNPFQRPQTAGGMPTLNQGSTTPNIPTAPNVPGGQQQGSTPTGNYGGYGNVYDVNGLQNSGQWNQLPPWLRSQYQQIGGGSEGGTSTYTLGNGQSGAFKDASGKDVVQVGTDPQHAPTKSTKDGSSIKDPSKMWFDKDLGWVTSPDNIQPNIDTNNFKTMFPLFLAMIATAGMAGAGGGGGLDFSSLFGGGGEAGAAGSGGFDLSSLFGNSGFVDTIGDAATGASAGASTTGSFLGGLSDLFSGAGKGLGGIGKGLGGFLSSILGGGGSALGSLLGGGGQGGSGGLNLGSLLQGGFNLYNDNKGIQQYKDMVADYMSKGDYNAQYRPGQLSKLNQFLMDPEAALQDPTYKASRERKLGDLSRGMNARGYGMSGNEMGELLKYGTEMDYSHIGDQENQLRQAASLGNPDQMARSGILTLPFLFQMMANRNSAGNGIFNQSGLGNLLGRPGGSNSNPFQRPPNGEDGPQWETTPPDTPSNIPDDVWGDDAGDDWWMHFLGADD